MNINWQLIARALDIYQQRFKYEYVEVPWIVGKDAVAVTLPPGREGMHCIDGALVGSAEQSFIQLMIDEKLKPGRYVAASPCFRDDDVDELHQRTFFKVELIDFSEGVVTDWGDRLQKMAEEALSFYKSIYQGRDAEIVPTAQGLDIEFKGVELGSYGYRSFRRFHWIYGTGFAEPRFSLATRHVPKLTSPVILDEFDAAIAAEHGGDGRPPRTKEPRRPTRR